MNTVIAGDYKNKLIFVRDTLKGPIMQIGNVKVSKKTVESYEVLNETSQVSSISAAGRAALGSAFFGPAGIAAGLGGRKKGTYWVAIQFKDGKRSLLEVNDKALRAITIALF